MTKSKSLTVANVQVAFLTGGVAKVTSLPEFMAHADPRATLKKTCASLAQYAQVDAMPLVDLLVALNAAKRANVGGRGVSAPEVGTERDYKVQANKATGALYLTVPLPAGTVEASKGDAVTIAFKDGSIVIY